MTEEQKNVSFEEALDKLEEIVTVLESGDVPLEKAIQLFQDGMELSQICSQKLDQVEKKIELITEDNEQMVKKTWNESLGEKGE